MNLLWIFIVVLIIFAMSFTWLPWIRARTRPSSEEILSDNDSAESRKQENIALFREQLAQLEKEREAGLSEEDYQARKTEIELRAYQELKASQEQTVLNRESTSVFWPLAIAAVVLSVSLGMYQLVGSADKVGQEPAVATEMTLQQQIKRLEKAVLENTKDSEAWFNLGYLYLQDSQYALSNTAFDKVIALVGEQPDLLGAKAQAMYYLAGNQLTDEIKAITEKSLAMDITEPATNLLLGSDSFAKQDFEKAIHYWRQAMASPRPDVNREALQQAVTQAQAMLDSSTQQQSEPASISLLVTLDKSLMTAASPDDTVFIYAHAPNQKMPLSIHRATVADFPVSVVLTDEQSMSPQANLSSVNVATIKAIVSKSGSAGLKEGDLVGVVRRVNTRGAPPVAVVIDTTVTDSFMTEEAKVMAEADQQASTSGNVDQRDQHKPLVRLNISVSDALKDKVSNDHTVFVFAADPEGQSVPLAVNKLSVSDLPAELVLTDAMAIAPMVKLSGVSVVDVFGLISVTPGEGIKPGDLQGIIRGVAVDDGQTINLVIDSVIEEE